MQVPADFRGPAAASEASSLADLPWWKVFNDPVLEELTRDAVVSNYNLAVAVARVQESSALIGVARSEIFPQVGYTGSGGRQKSVILPGADPATFNLFAGAFNLAWEIDLWGRIRRSTEAAEAYWMAAEANRRGVMLSLVSLVAEDYFRLLELDEELRIAIRTEGSFKQSLDLFERRYQGGVGNDLAVSRARAALASVSATVPQIQAAIVSTENAINLLLGRAPGPIERRGSALDKSEPPVTPAGLPSELLQRRPDLKQAEDQIRAANAEVGVAVANFFPRIGLSSLYGASNPDISQMLSGTNGIWGAVVSISGPLFTGGRNVLAYDARVAAWEGEVAAYKQAVLQAFGEVSDTLTLQQNLTAERIQRVIASTSLQRSVELSLLRYELGLADYFEVIQAQQELYPAELDLARVRRDQLLVVARLYRALGGGWNLPTDQWGKLEPNSTGTVAAAAPLPVTQPRRTPVTPRRHRR
jgi:multidrug efflux system outer membrane protein